MEKRKPHHDLNSIQAQLNRPSALRMTRTARNSAFSLGLTLEGVVALIQGLRREHFYKSMTSEADSTLWQDVYHVPYEELTLYVKFTRDEEGFFLLSLKEK